MKAAIYSRKSKFTGKGDSIENQIQLCKKYGQDKLSLKEENFIIYEDEGFSGSNTDRPQFKALIKDLKEKKFQVLICYRLDRISRNVTDFSSTLDLLEKHNISFISIKENFDTTNPMGKAMIYIASVFSQLERETIAERIRDNMLQLAKTGRWLGGNTPTGYASEQIIKTTIDGKQRKLFKLIAIDKEVKIVQLLFSKYLELRSITKLESFCVQNNLQTRKSKEFTRYSLRFMLGNPVYAVADQDSYQFFKNNNHDIYSEEKQFDGQHGIMAYNKTSQKNKSNVRFRDHSEWIIAIGEHPGIIAGSDWSKVQELLLQNKSKSYRKVKSTSSLLSGIIKCGNCGSFMRPKIHNKPNKDGIITFSYMCELKEKSKKTRCSIDNAPGNLLDKLVIDKIKELTCESSNFSSSLNKKKMKITKEEENVKTELELLNNSLQENNQAIENLVNLLSEGKESSAAQYMVKKINILDEQNKQLKERIFNLNQLEETKKSSKQNLDFIEHLLSDFINQLDILDVIQKQAYLKSIIDKIIWDGQEADIKFFGGKTLKK